MNSNECYLNVKFSETIAEINVAGFEDLSEVQDAIKDKYREVIPVPPAFIQLYTVNGDLINTWKKFRSLPAKYFTKGGPCVVIRTLLPPTRESSKNDLTEEGIDYLIPEIDPKRKKRRFEWEISTVAQLSYEHRG